MKAVIFDVGRVLVHWEPTILLESIAQISQVDTEQIRGLLKTVDRALDSGQLDGPALHRYLIEHAGTAPDYDRFCQAFCRALGRDERGLATAVQLSQDGFRIGVISNTNAIHASWLRNHIPELAAFAAVVFSVDTGLRKPDPAIFRLALERLSVPAHSTLFIDDIAEFVVAAQALGMAGIVHQRWDTTQSTIESWRAGSALSTHTDL